MVSYLADHGITINRVLTDRGSEFFMPSGKNAYQAYLEQTGISHLKIKAYNSSKINGLCFEYMQHVLAQFCTPAARQNKIESLDDLSNIFMQWLDSDNRTREDTSAYCFGKTHYATLTAGA